MYQDDRVPENTPKIWYVQKVEFIIQTVAPGVAIVNTL